MKIKEAVKKRINANVNGGTSWREYLKIGGAAPQITSAMIIASIPGIVLLYNTDYE